MSKLTLAGAISAFGAAAKAKLTNPAATGQPEDQLRTPLVNLFEDFAELTGKSGNVILVGETSLAGAQTRPDFAVTVGAGKAKALIGFIEVKAPGKGSDPRKFKDPHDKGQWAKLKALPNLLYTDGQSFSLWRDSEHRDGEHGEHCSASTGLTPRDEPFETLDAPRRRSSAKRGRAPASVRAEPDTTDEQPHADMPPACRNSCSDSFRVTDPLPDHWSASTGFPPRHESFVSAVPVETPTPEPQVQQRPGPRIRRL